MVPDEHRRRRRGRPRRSTGSCCCPAPTTSRRRSTTTPSCTPSTSASGRCASTSTPATPHETFGGVMSLGGPVDPRRGRTSWHEADVTASAARRPAVAAARSTPRATRQGSTPPSPRCAGVAVEGAPLQVVVVSTSRLWPGGQGGARSSIDVPGATHGDALGRGLAAVRGRPDRLPAGRRRARCRVRRGRARRLEREHGAALVCARRVASAVEPVRCRRASPSPGIRHRPVGADSPDERVLPDRRRGPDGTVCPATRGWPGGPSSTPSAPSTRGSISPSPASTWPGGSGSPVARCCRSGLRCRSPTTTSARPAVGRRRIAGRGRRAVHALPQPRRRQPGRRAAGRARPQPGPPRGRLGRGTPTSRSTASVRAFTALAARARGERLDRQADRRRPDAEVLGVLRRRALRPTGR